MNNKDDGVFGNILCSKQDLVAGGFKVVCNEDLETYPTSLIEVLEKYSKLQPQKPLFIEENEEGENQLTFEKAYHDALQMASILLSLRGSSDRPLALIADNSIKAAQIILACYAAGIVVAPISPSYSRGVKDFEKLNYIINLLDPALIVFDDANQHNAAMSEINWTDKTGITLDRMHAQTMSWEELCSHQCSDHAMPKINPNDPAKVLFTSGSTGRPKGVINSQKMMCSNQQALSQIWPILKNAPLQLVDWLPWNHTFGGNQNFNMALFFGGTLVIDRGKPVEGAFERTVRALKKSPPSVYFNVPLGFDFLVNALAKDSELKEIFFSNVELIGYAGAALPTPIWNSIKEMAFEVKGRAIPLVSMWGSTETGPVATAVYFENENSANIGLPMPGTEIKFIKSNDGKLDMRVKGPSVTTAYWSQKDMAATIFDDDGFLIMGDAGKLVDQNNINAGILFDGRLGENFKLLSGTWVNVGDLRLKLISACPELISDAVIAGHNQTDITAIIFPKLEACRALLEDKALTDKEVLSEIVIKNKIVTALSAYNLIAGGGSRRVNRIVLQHVPPSIEKSEITEKGYINQAKVLQNRMDIVDALYAGQDHTMVIDLATPKRPLSKTKAELHV